jgi:hypothetical protein
MMAEWLKRNNVATRRIFPVVFWGTQGFATEGRGSGQMHTLLSKSVDLWYGVCRK